MKKNGWFSRYILIWAYGRGTLQYDIICILILAFIFLVDPGCFRKQNDELVTSRPSSSRSVLRADVSGDPKGIDYDSGNPQSPTR